MRWTCITRTRTIYSWIQFKLSARKSYRPLTSCTRHSASGTGAQPSGVIPRERGVTSFHLYTYAEISCLRSYVGKFLCHAPRARSPHGSIDHTVFRITNTCRSTTYRRSLRKVPSARSPETTSGPAGLKASSFDDDQPEPQSSVSVYQQTSAHLNTQRSTVHAYISYLEDHRWHSTTM